MRAAPTLRLRFDPVLASNASQLADFSSCSDWPYHHELELSDTAPLSELPEVGRFGGDTRHDEAEPS